MQGAELCQTCLTRVMCVWRLAIPLRVVSEPGASPIPPISVFPLAMSNPIRGLDLSETSAKRITVWPACPCSPGSMVHGPCGVLYMRDGADSVKLGLEGLGTLDLGDDKVAGSLPTCLSLKLARIVHGLLIHCCNDLTFSRILHRPQSIPTTFLYTDRI